MVRSLASYSFYDPCIPQGAGIMTSWQSPLHETEPIKATPTGHFSVPSPSLQDL